MTGVQTCALPICELILFEIKRLFDKHDTANVKNAYCELSALELLDEHIEDVRPTNCGAEFALIQALTGTRWESGIVDSFGSQSTRYFRINPLAAINKILTTWGGEVRFRITLTDLGQITGRYVDILARRGASTGKRFEYAKDMESIERTVDISNIKTALYGYGRGEETGDGFGRRITFDEVEWTTAAGEPVDKPLDQKWVGDADALEQWGRAQGTKHRYGQYENPDIEDPEELLQATWAELQRRKEPLASYQLKVADLEHIAGLEHEAVRLGDTVAVIDRAINPPIEVSARVVELKRYLNEAHRSAVILGNFLPSITDDAAKLRAIQSTVHDRTGIWNQKITAGVSYKSVYIDGDSGLRVLDESNVERLGLGEYDTSRYALRAYDDAANLRAIFGESANGKHGFTLYSKDGTKVVLDEDGVLNAYQVNVADNLSPGKPLVMRVYVPAGVSRVDSMEMVAFTDKFRAYQVGAESAGAESYIIETDSIYTVLNAGSYLLTPAMTIPAVASPFIWHRNVASVLIEARSNTGYTADVWLFIDGAGVLSWTDVNIPAYSSKRLLSADGSPSAAFLANRAGKSVQVSIHNKSGGPRYVNASATFTVETKHIHAPEYAIYEDALPLDVSIIIDGTDRTLALGGPWGNEYAPEAIGPLQLAPYIQTPGWHTIEFTSTTLGRVTAALTTQQFIQTV